MTPCHLLGLALLAGAGGRGGAAGARGRRGVAGPVSPSCPPWRLWGSRARGCCDTKPQAAARAPPLLSRPFQAQPLHRPVWFRPPGPALGDHGHSFWGTGPPPFASPWCRHGECALLSVSRARTQVWDVIAARSWSKQQVLLMIHLRPSGHLGRDGGPHLQPVLPPFLRLISPQTWARRRGLSIPPTPRGGE